MPSTCKIDRVCRAYDIHDADERLRYRHQKNKDSLRDLEAFLNTRILRQAMEEAGMSVLDGEADQYYHALVAGEDGESVYARSQVETILRDAGVDVAQVQQDFVSYRTVKTHLNDCLGLSTSRLSQPDPGNDRDTIAKLSNRIKQVADKALTRLRSHGIVQITEPRVTVDVTVRCGGCGRRHDLLQFLTVQQTCPCLETDSGTS